MLQGFVTKELCDLHYVDKLKNFAANIFLKLVCQSCTLICVSIGQSRTWIYALKGEIVITLQVQLGIGVRVQLQVGIRYQDSLLVTACFNNNGFSGVVTLNSPDGVLPRWFFPFVNKSPMSNLFSPAFTLVGDLFVLPRYCILN